MNLAKLQVTLYLQQPAFFTLEQESCFLVAHSIDVYHEQSDPGQQIVFQNRKEKSWFNDGR